MLHGHGIRQLLPSVATWLAAFVAATVVGAICFGVYAWERLSGRLPSFDQLSLDDVAGSALIGLEHSLLISSGVLAALALLRVLFAILARARRQEGDIETSLLGGAGLLISAVLLAVGSMLLMGAAEVSRWLGDTAFLHPIRAFDSPPGYRLIFLSEGLFIIAGVVTALASTQAMSAVGRWFEHRNPHGDSSLLAREDARPITSRVLPGALSGWALGFIVIVAVGSLCLWLGLLDLWWLVTAARLPFIESGTASLDSDLRPDVIEVTGWVLRAMGRGLAAGAGVLVALVWVQRSVRSIDRRPVGLTTNARRPVTVFGVMVLAATIVYWLLPSVVYLDPVSLGPVESGSVILFGWLVLWDSVVGKLLVSSLLLHLGQGLMVGTAVAAIPALLQSHPQAQQELGEAGAHRDLNAPTARVVALGFIATLLAGGLCFLLGSVALGESIGSLARVLAPIQVELSSGLFIGAGVLAAVMVTVALGALQRRVSEPRSQDAQA